MSMETIMLLGIEADLTRTICLTWFGGVGILALLVVYIVNVIFEYSKFEKNPKEYYRVMLELRKLRNEAKK